jgi:hypothetical protein
MTFSTVPRSGRMNLNRHDDQYTGITMLNEFIKILNGIFYPCNTLGYTSNLLCVVTGMLALAEVISIGSKLCLVRGGF